MDSRRAFSPLSHQDASDHRLYSQESDPDEPHHPQPLTEKQSSTIYDEFNQLEQSVMADFQRYLTDVQEHLSLDKAASHDGEESVLSHLEPVPFVTDIEPPFDVANTRDPLDASVHSEYDILEGGPRDHLSDSWQNIEEQQRHVGDEQSEASASDNQWRQQSTSPGQYFRARSLPFESVDHVWQHRKPSFATHSARSSSYNRILPQHAEQPSNVASITDDPLAHVFKALPSSLQSNHHICDDYLSAILSALTLSPTSKPTIKQDDLLHAKEKTTIQTSDADIATRVPRENDAANNRSASPQVHPLYEVYPKHLTFHDSTSSSSSQSQGNLVQLNLRNLSPHEPLEFSLFCAHSKVTFQAQQGIVEADTSVNVAVTYHGRRSFTLPDMSSCHDTILLLINQEHSNQLPVEIVNSANEDTQADTASLTALSTPVVQKVSDSSNRCKPGRPPCRFCLLAQYYPAR
ncbi:uncharacterized protein BYT42DRAFT_71849 [Radiomyces spectabilis]|uniref:uncharacterized protein n=1 Tax=Radiomyces spectabilis TaxID=64574 RepID=UPI00221E53B4|nr:uncharacterized protein BYT42DRAFT_71849 [Radiomyces spectabilis]KAI8371519.1 hypothetical protein BYT42DRAFT_71849 [Radiomyces spectabilis]